MTTDTHPKQVIVEGSGFVVGGIAKGAAMLAPNMATMLAILTTDAAVDAAVLQSALRAAVDESFNELTIDGCTSTNDTVIALASGLAAPATLEQLTAALSEACRDLAHQMAADAEGGTKVVRVTVTGATDDASATAGARRIADANLVKCSWYGADPNWGRVVSELGSAGITFDLATVSVSYGPHTVCVNGTAAAHDVEAVAAYLSGKEIELICDLGLGSGRGSVLSADLTHGYIDENMGLS
jgi:glutamate N-acetyltransferase/amino-acid N-acetyltransferase